MPIANDNGAVATNDRRTQNAAAGLHAPFRDMGKIGDDSRASAGVLGVALNAGPFLGLGAKRQRRKRRQKKRLRNAKPPGMRPP